MICEASNGLEAVEFTERFKSSAIVMGYHYAAHERNGGDRQNRGQIPDIAVIGMSVNASAANEDAMRTAVASTLLTKEAAVDQLHGAIQQAVREMGKPARQMLRRPV